MTYSVKPLRAAGLEVRWGKSQKGAPHIAARNPHSKLAHQRNQWWVVGDAMFKDMEKIGILEAFDNHTLLGDIFSV